MAWSRALPCSRQRSSSNAPRTGPNRYRRRWQPRSRADSGEVQDRSGMALELLFVVDPLDGLKAYKDSTVAMMRAAARRGHAVYAAAPDELAAGNGAVTARAHRLELAGDDHSWYVDRGADERALESFTAVLMRKDPPFDVEFLNATLLLSLAAAHGARIVNHAQAARDHNAQ